MKTEGLHNAKECPQEVVGCAEGLAEPAQTDAEGRGSPRPTGTKDDMSALKHRADCHLSWLQLLTRALVDPIGPHPMRKPSLSWPHVSLGSPHKVSHKQIGNVLWSSHSPSSMYFRFSKSYLTYLGLRPLMQCGLVISSHEHIRGHMHTHSFHPC